MKTAVSLPNELFDAAEVLADELGVTRSELYARAIDEYVRNTQKSEVAKRLKAFYGDSTPPDTVLSSYAGKILVRAEW